MFKNQVIGFIIISLFFIGIDFYVWQGIKFLIQNWSSRARSIFRYTYWGYTVFTFLWFLMIRFFDLRMPHAFTRILTALIFAIFVSKLLWMVYLIVDDLIRLFRWGASYAVKPDAAVEHPHRISRLKFINYMGLGTAAAFVGAAVWGIAKGAHNYAVRYRDLPIAGLPDEFNGLKILQISDIHSGSFWSPDAVQRGVNMIKEQNADMVFFTGDLVNDRSSEIQPYMKMFSSIKAPLGVFSILGNHDYGDYVGWDSPSAKLQNLQDLVTFQREMGWDILMDEHRVIEKNGKKLAIVGIQNWSNKARFPKHGDLKKALKGSEDIQHKLLLSHDPSHWKAQVLGFHPEIVATFSGHTHGMQFGIDTRHYKWSPVKLVYKEWIDLYTEGKQHLYVNRGFGYLGFPGRIGINPEISVFTLKQA